MLTAVRPVFLHLDSAPKVNSVTFKHDYDGLDKMAWINSCDAWIQLILMRRSTGQPAPTSSKVSHNFVPPKDELTQCRDFKFTIWNSNHHHVHFPLAGMDPEIFT